MRPLILVKEFHLDTLTKGVTYWTPHVYIKNVSIKHNNDPEY